MRCPFAFCLGEFEPISHRQYPVEGQPTEYVMVVPRHDVVGEEWYGECPAFMLRVPEITEDGRRWLADQTIKFAKRRVQRAGKEIARAAMERMDRGEHEPLVELDGGEPVPDGVVGGSSGAGPDRPAEEFFPGRPADAPEPGVGEAPAMPVPEHVTAIPHTGRNGANDMSSMRAEIKGMLALAEQKWGESQDALAQCTALAEGVHSTLAAAISEHSVAHSVAAAVVGQDSSAPMAAANMMGSSAAAEATMRDINGTLALLLSRIDAAHQSMAAAASSASTYQAQI